jgi:hypothetical protein
MKHHSGSIRGNCVVSGVSDVDLFCVREDESGNF